tara:strand:- start:1674 stop:2396 length:723 start_codon:yes stop_codon:yes gene_type:complete
MALPKVAVPTYSINLPSDGSIIEFRPFLVKEEKILLLGIKQAAEMEDLTLAQSHLIKTFKAILKECILTKGYDLEEAPVFDLEYIFINIRAKSVGEIVEPTYTCSCGTPVEVQVNLTEIEVTQPKDKKMTVDLGGGVGIKMKYPKADIMEKLVYSTEEVDKIFSILIHCIDYIFDSETTFKASEYEESELITFLEELPKDAFQNIQDFFEDMPHTEYTAEADCPEGKETFTIRQLSDFFV